MLQKIRNNSNLIKVLISLFIICMMVPLAYVSVRYNFGRLLLGERLSNLGFEFSNPDVLALILRRIFLLAVVTVGGYSLFSSIFHKRLDHLIGLLICGLPILIHFSPTFGPKYIDKAGNVTAVNLTSIILIIIFIMFVIYEKDWFFYSVKHRTILAMISLCFFGLFTQIYNFRN